jgi:hypothetical protein
MFVDGGCHTAGQSRDNKAKQEEPEQHHQGFNDPLTLEVGAAVRKGTMEGDLVCLLDTATRRKSLRDPGHMDSCGSQHFGKIVGSRLSLDISAQRQDHFGGMLLPDSLEEFSNPELFGTNAVQRGKFPAKGMIAAAENAGALQRQDVGRRLDDAKFAPCSPFIPAKGTLLRLGKEAAETACPEHLPRPADRTDQLLGLRIPGTKHPEGDPLGAPRADARETAQLSDQFAEGFGVVEEHGVGKLLAV